MGLRDGNHMTDERWDEKPVRDDGDYDKDEARERRDRVNEMIRPTAYVTAGYLLKRAEVLDGLADARYPESSTLTSREAYFCREMAARAETQGPLTENTEIK